MHIITVIYYYYFDSKELNSSYCYVARVTVYIRIFMRSTRQSQLAKRGLGSEETRRQHWQWFHIPDRLHADDQILVSMVQ